MLVIAFIGFFHARIYITGNSPHLAPCIKKDPFRGDLVVGPPPVLRWGSLLAAPPRHCRHSSGHHSEHRAPPSRWWVLLRQTHHHPTQPGGRVGVLCKEIRCRGKAGW
eukprot:TRINITY_DN21441_c0_g1_i1.p3 TRINITY_DN21441_c0_g1~~TRINITY_DN21441_c0_g1_i1.p3  ORF type:complete len:108 (-),score=5.05 TRINITY_DN21441_c0_g1_i1:709-1032(-)